MAIEGDLGDPNDPRRVIVTEYRIVFEDEKAEDVVFYLGEENSLNYD